ncbi:cytochrome P450 [Cladorrhinum sp. PSN259]|nr:cytochrome P450 [Cladorrhinum sp. PSN259]
MEGDLDIPAITTLIVALSVVFYLSTTLYGWYRLRHIPGPLFVSLSYTWFGFWMWRGRTTRILGKIQRQYGPIVRIGANVVLYASVRLDPSGHNIVCEPDTARHDARKAQLTAPYTGKRRYAGADGKVLDLSRIARYFVVDVVTAVMLGKPWGNVANETDSFQFFGMMDSRLPFVHSIAVVPSLRSFFYSPFFLSLAGPKPTDKSGIGHFIGNVLDEWLKLGITYDECQRETLLHIPAGSETTATAIIATMFYLLSSPPVYRKLKNEIAKGIQERRISSPITVDEAKALPYLQAVICEGFRLASPVNSGFSKRVPAGGDAINGIFLAGGTEIIQLKVIDLGFGHGRWMCPGKALSWVQLNKVYVELLRRFDFQIPNPDKPKRSASYQGSRIHDFWVKVTDDKLD